MSDQLRSLPGHEALSPDLPGQHSVSVCLHRPPPGGGSFHSRLGVRQLLAAMLIATFATAAYAIDIYKTFLTPEAFLAETFAGAVPAPQTLMLDDAMQSQIRAVFGRPYPQARLRYWRAAGRTAWIFDDIGKEGYVPTTCGFVIREGTVENARVLIYRESRGEQIAEPSFLNQLLGARAAGPVLDQRVDGITGATLSVQMMQRMARTALTFDALAP